MKRKLRDVRGETIVEVLAAILIASLSIGLLFGAVTVSGSIERRTQELDEKSYSDLSGAQMKTAPVIVGSEVTISSGSGSVDVPVIFYGGGGIFSYSASASP